MTIEQAINIIIQSNTQARLYALEKIIQSLESDGFDIDNDKFIIKSKQELAQYKEFYFPTFNMGGGELPTRSELYDEACDRHLKFNK